DDLRVMPPWPADATNQWLMTTPTEKMASMTSQPSTWAEGSSKIVVNTNFPSKIASTSMKTMTMLPSSYSDSGLTMAYQPGLRRAAPLYYKAKRCHGSVHRHNQHVRRRRWRRRWPTGSGHRAYSSTSPHVLHTRVARVSCTVCCQPRGTTYSSLPVM
ncbi:unnamed protein product, partial [Meganyctiphanes norvegica]